MTQFELQREVPSDDTGRGLLSTIAITDSYLPDGVMYLVAPYMTPRGVSMLNIMQLKGVEETRIRSPLLL